MSRRLNAGLGEFFQRFEREFGQLVKNAVAGEEAAGEEGRGGVRITLEENGLIGPLRDVHLGRPITVTPLDSML